MKFINRLRSIRRIAVIAEVVIFGGDFRVISVKLFSFTASIIPSMNKPRNPAWIVLKKKNPSMKRNIPMIILIVFLSHELSSKKSK